MKTHRALTVCRAAFRDWATGTDPYTVAELASTLRGVPSHSFAFPLDVGSDGRVYGAGHHHVSRFPVAVAARAPEADEIGAGEPWRFASPVRPDTTHVRALRVIDTIGETVAGLVLIAGGAVLTALATLA